jgi:hypothetical protein
LRIGEQCAKLKTHGHFAHPAGNSEENSKTKGQRGHLSAKPIAQPSQPASLGKIANIGADKHPRVVPACQIAGRSDTRNSAHASWPARLKAIQRQRNPAAEKPFKVICSLRLKVLKLKVLKAKF